MAARTCVLAERRVQDCAGRGTGHEPFIAAGSHANVSDYE
jgi:hypothetical protein